MNSPAPAAALHPVPAPVEPACFARLQAGLHAAAPQASPAAWIPALKPALLKAECTTPRRVAAYLGQCAVEAGAGFQNLAENTNYTSPSRLLAIFPREFTPATARVDAGHPNLIADVAYANRLGNGSAATGDGWNFRGHGLIQVTGRAEFTQFASWCGKTVSDAAAWALTPPGAAMTAAWFWSAKGLNTYADTWSLSAITLRVNGTAMLGNAERIAASNAALKAMGG